MTNAGCIIALLIVVCIACQSAEEPHLVSYPTPESTGISGVVGNPSPTPDTEQYSMGEHCLPLFENLEVKKFLADLGVRELDDFELRGMSNSSMIDSNERLLTFEYKITDSSGEQVWSVSGAILDINTCEATRIKAQ